EPHSSGTTPARATPTPARPRRAGLAPAPEPARRPRARARRRQLRARPRAPRAARQPPQRPGRSRAAAGRVSRRTSASLFPMPKEEKVELEGEVVEALPNAMFRVKLDNMDRVVLGHVAGKMRRFRIRILPGHRVRVELPPHDLDRARIVYRHR